MVEVVSFMWNLFYLTVFIRLVDFPKCIESYRFIIVLVKLLTKIAFYCSKLKKK